MSQKPLKVYYCRNCGMRMPLYYKKDAPYRDENWTHCYRCHGTNLVSQVEAWDPRRENAVNAMCTADTLPKMMQSAKLMNPPTAMPQAPRSAPPQAWGEQQPRTQARSSSWGQPQSQRREPRSSGSPQSWSQPQQTAPQQSSEPEWDVNIPW
ncbi:hypothetical protein [Thiomonas sp. FB-Cd]|uniref:hypothetical protein n=1 Tax=Thiomonas sp. FB-Cd TaxID=1158292 RepID=UPI0004DF9EFE|nr:hypothetical protein [Thiomonas sp. FB-Cd]